MAANPLVLGGAQAASRMAIVSGAHMVHLLPTLVLGVLAATFGALPLRALLGLRCYYASLGAPGDVAGRGKNVRARGKAGTGKKDDDIDLGGAESLVVAPVNVRQLAQLPYYHTFENLVSPCCVCGQAAQMLCGGGVWDGGPCRRPGRSVA